MTTKRFSSRWYTDCIDEEQKKERRKLVENSSRLRKVLDKILDKSIELSYKPSTIGDMAQPSWPILKAYKEGYAKALHDLKELID